MNSITRIVSFAFLAIFIFAPARAQVPSILNYQGRVTVGGTNLTTNAALFKFALVGADGAAYWKNDGTTTTNEPSNAVTVAVAQGLYSTLLGDTTLSNMAAIPSSAFTNENVNLRVWFSAGDTNDFVALSPDQRIAASGYALRAAVADSANVTNVSGDLAVSGTLSAGQLVAGVGSVASGSGAAIGGGSENTASAPLSVIGGGMLNTASDNFAVIGGGQYNTNSGYAGAVGGGKENTASTNFATVGGGYRNTNSGYAATVGGGQENAASSNFSTVAGGLRNTASGSFWGRATVGGGGTNTASEDYATVGGGRGNTASGSNAVIAGGFNNLASGQSAAVGGGQENTAAGNYATVPGGQLNTATNFAFASGYRAKATNDGAFVWADSEDADFASTTNNQFLIRAAAGVGINTNNPGTNALSVAGSASIAGNLNVGSINGRTNLSTYTTTFSFVQNNGTVGQSLVAGTNVVATFVQRPGVAITSCSIAYSLTSLLLGTVNFYDVTGLSTSTIGTNSLIPGGAQTFTAGAALNTYKSYELGGLNIASPSSRIVQIVMYASSGGSSVIKIYSITVGFSQN